MSDFQTTIERHAAEFAHAILAAVKNLLIDDLSRFLAENEGVARHGAPAKTAPVPARAPAPAKMASVPPPPPAPAPARAEAGPSEMEVSILEHLNEAGPTGSTVRAWVISTQGELPSDEHSHFE